MKSIRNNLCAVVLVVLVGCSQDGSATQGRTAGQHASQARTDVKSASTLCQADERVIFSCHISGKEKTASVCGSPDMEGEGRYITYRYGRGSHIELIYPETKVGSFSKFFYASYTRPLLTRQSLRFVSGGYEYVIEVENNAEEKPHFYTAGVSVSGAKRLELECENEGLKGLDVNVQGALPCDSESAWAEYSCNK